MPSATVDTASQELVITRLFEAPRELVFQTWTTPEHLQHWFAPTGCTVEFQHLDVRPGGTFHCCIRNPLFHDCWTVGVYHEVLAPERLVYNIAIANEHGQRMAPVEMGMDPEWPAETLVTITFDEQDGKTLLTLRQAVNEALAKRTGAHPSWLIMLDRLADHLRTGERG